MIGGLASAERGQPLEFPVQHFVDNKGKIVPEGRLGDVEFLYVGSGFG